MQRSVSEPRTAAAYLILSEEEEKGFAVGKKDFFLPPPGPHTDFGTGPAAPPTEKRPGVL